jgi:hypothetical protein
MDTFKDRTKGKDTISGSILGVHILGPADDEQQPELLHIRLTTDTEQSVYLKATKQGLDELIARAGKTATFVGEFLNEEKKHLGCDSIYFWGEESQ